MYDRSLHNLKTRPMIIPPQLTASQRRDAVMDHYQSIRTNILLAWVLTNVRSLLCAVDKPAVLNPVATQAVLVATILNGDYSSTFANGSGTSRAKVCECGSRDFGVCTPLRLLTFTPGTKTSSSS